MKMYSRQLFVASLIFVFAAVSCKSDVKDIPTLFRQTMAKYHSSDTVHHILGSTSPVELKARMSNFRQSVDVVENVNNNKNLEFSATLNHISLMTDNEVKAMLNMNESLLTAVPGDDSKLPSLPWKSEDLFAPNNVDWLAKGAQTHVKDQGGCGSCWAFSAVSSVEAAYYITTGQLIQFSEQEYVDCTYEHKGENTDGCKGAWMQWAWEYSKAKGRLAANSDFGYVGKDRSCNMASTPNAFKTARIVGTEFVSKNDVALKGAVSKTVVAVAIQANDQFAYYKNGIFSCTGSCVCNKQLNHAVNIVGYTSTFWNVRNSWGTQWGDKGYIKMSRAQDNICLINQYAMFPVVKCKSGSSCREEGNNDDHHDKDSGDKCGVIQKSTGNCLDSDLRKICNSILNGNDNEEQSNDGCSCPPGTERCPDGVCRHAHMC